jgi:hypothetical protein
MYWAYIGPIPNNNSGYVDPQVAQALAQGIPR